MHSRQKPGEPRFGQHLPSVLALTSENNELLSAELRILAARRQIAVVRTIADQLESVLANSATFGGLRDQLVEEVARLAYRSLEAASEMVRQAPEQSGVYPVLRSLGRVAHGARGQE
jgi:hypothetical protein